MLYIHGQLMSYGSYSIHGQLMGHILFGLLVLAMDIQDIATSHKDTYSALVGILVCVLGV